MARSAVLSVSAVVVALAAGVLVAPAAGAVAPGPVVSGPMAAPVPGFASTGVRTQGCTPGETPGWVGTADLTLGVAVQSPDGAAATARFSVRDEHTGQAVKTTAPVADGTATTKPAGLLDGRTYAWQAQALTAHATGRPTPWCAFRVDTSAPNTPVVGSTDFPATGTPVKYAGQYGDFTFAATDPAPATGRASGIACYHYTFTGTLDVGWTCQSPDTVPAGADGKATARLRPTGWGGSTLRVQTMDEAGNVSSPVDYSFYAPSNPNPPNTPGDVDGDGVPDILLPDAAGNLQIISAAAGSTAPSSTVAAARGPVGAGWTGARLAHRGSTGAHLPMDDLLAHEPGGSALYLYGNSDFGGFGQGASLVNRPADNPYNPVPAGFAADWSHAEQIVSLGALTRPWGAVLLTVEDGDLWYLNSMPFIGTVRRLSTTGTWSGYDLIAPGKQADGSVLLWSREKATGTLRGYTVSQGADGSYDFSVLADPAGGTVLGSFPAAEYPVLGSSGDGNGDGKPDLYAVTAARHLLTFDGVAAPKDLGLLK
ncbi:hypothetical protein CFP65_2841 [Kitasatospora sp. MMS16-BH015]|uniref:hypothetical protein n=1 Tax=Kitasatospora sp. MMS16-BH015 TaxID=2018025 RepID=UPI000CA37C06|nr:hypothetical protein [Kitasatospora sp. MMS16-BH015]AUG77657.1 hypothetical protein CFP65_2841 [Kitasatospora sp. MMS16-BH015]